MSGYILEAHGGAGPGGERGGGKRFNILFHNTGPDSQIQNRGMSMGKKSAIRRVLSLLSAAFFLLGIGCEKTDVPPKPSGLPMKCTRYYWPGNFWKEIAQEKGWFAEAGLQVELVDTNPDYFKSLKETAEGRLDENGFTLFDLILFRARGYDLVGVINTDDSNGMDVLVAGENVKSLHDLKGGRVGLPKGTYLEYLLSAALSMGGLTFNDVTLVDMPAERTADFLAKGEVDAVITWEPHAGEAMGKAKGHRLFDTSEVHGLSPSLGVFREAFIRERPEDVKAYVGVWRRTTRFIQEHPEEAFGIIARIYGKPLQEVQAMAGRNRILNFKENIIAFSFGAGSESLHGSWSRMNHFLVESGACGDLMDSSQGLDGGFLRQLKRRGGKR